MQPFPFFSYCCRLLPVFRLIETLRALLCLFFLLFFFGPRVVAFGAILRLLLFYLFIRLFIEAFQILVL